MAVHDDPIKALLPELINGKTHEQLTDEIAAADKKKGDHFIGGVKFPFVVQQSNLDAMKTFEVRDDDVLLFGYIRSGNHWMSEILHWILNDGRDDFDRAFMNFGLEMTVPTDPSLSMESITPGHIFFEGMRPPRYIWGHCLECYLPPQVFTKKAKVVYVARNPKDMLVSVHKQMQGMRTSFPPLNFDEELWEFYTGQALFGSWFDHVLGYWKHREHANFLFLKYEDLHKDLRGWIFKLAKYVGKDLSNDVIDKITEHVKFDGMQKAYQKVEDEGSDEAKFKTRAFGTTPFLRKGRVGTWKDTFTVAQSALFDKIYALKMEGTGLEFDFEL